MDTENNPNGNAEQPPLTPDVVVKFHADWSEEYNEAHACIPCPGQPSGAKDPKLLPLRAIEVSQLRGEGITVCAVGVYDFGGGMEPDKVETCGFQIPIDRVEEVIGALRTALIRARAENVKYVEGALEKARKYLAEEEGRARYEEGVSKLVDDEEGGCIDKAFAGE